MSQIVLYLLWALSAIVAVRAVKPVVADGHPGMVLVGSVIAIGTVVLAGFALGLIHS